MRKAELCGIILTTMKFDSIFNVFSSRNKEKEPYTYQISMGLRNNILRYCNEVFSNRNSEWSTGDYSQEFWKEIHDKLLYRHGRWQLTNPNTQLNPAEDTINFLLQCSDDEFIDFIEYIFTVSCMFHVTIEENAIVSEINTLFIAANAGYELTNMVKEKVVEPVNDYPFHGREVEVIKTISYPQVIRKDSEVIHNMVVKPALNLISHPQYKTANIEYLEALEHFRRTEYGDCLTKSCSALESVMKIICHRKKWPYNQSDTVSTLVNIVVKNSGLDSSFTQPLVVIASIRNKYSKSHGAGVRPRKISQNIAQYVLNSTASAIILMINEVGK